MEIEIYDTGYKGKRIFKPMVEGKVGMYVCGLTVYDLPHIGHARTFVVFDVVRKFLRSLGYDVLLVRNHTDIDDKIIKRSREEGVSPEELSKRMIEGLDEDMLRLGVEVADIAPRVTEHIGDIISYIENLVERGFAYPCHGDVYFRVHRLESYGELSGRRVEEMLSGVRVELCPDKENPEDFALWKGVKSEDEPSWESPWGRGRPGWHIECSVMSTKYLGNDFDIHGGGRDLIFPHHENEIAQAKGSCDCSFARYWMHVGMVEIEGEKMSHSLNNFWTVRDLLEQVHRDALRYFFLTTHYRNNINFSRQLIQESTQRVTCLYRCIEGINQVLERYSGSEVLLKEVVERPHLDSFIGAMCDDFNSAKALASLSQCAHEANELLDQKGKVTEERVRRLIGYRESMLEMGKCVGLFTSPASEVLCELRAYAVKRLGLDVEAIESLISRRSEARQSKDWALADKLRDELIGMGVQVLDKPGCSCWQVD